MTSDRDQLLHDLRNVANVALEALREYQRYPAERQLLGTSLSSLDRLIRLTTLAETEEAQSREQRVEAVEVALGLLLKTDPTLRPRGEELELQLSRPLTRDLFSLTPKYAAARLRQLLAELGLTAVVDDTSIRLVRD